MSKQKAVAAALLASVALFLTPARAEKHGHQNYDFDMPAQDLGDALRTVTARAGWELYATSNDVNGVPAPALHGTMTAPEAVELLLRGTGLKASIKDGAVIVRGRSQASVTESVPAPEIIVTGSHIRGGAVTANVISMSRLAMENAGQNDLGEAVRSLPQNFNGGQNPGVGQGAGLTNNNLNSASSINLRGLGTDATLTLLNGHRLPYDSAFQGVDISAIPEPAIERIDILADGASALYGSDAVAGVANVVLRRDYDGLSTSVKLGASTDGGDFQQQADIVAGHHWASGGLMIAYDFAHNSGISASQRNYTSSILSDNTLYPSQRRHAVIGAFHQALSDSVEFSIDAFYNKRRSTTIASYDAGSIPVRYLLNPTVATFSVAPALKISVGTWQIRAVGSIGGDNSHYGGTITEGDQASSSFGCYCNRATSAELNADGRLIDLPAGPISLAIGVGYRDNKMHSTRYDDGVSDGAFQVGQHVFYGYSELSIPLVGRNQAIWGINELTLSAAGRYEDYPGIARVATPKLGLLYKPTHDISIKGAWGRSFKAPTLYQQYVNDEVDLLSAASYGVGPAGSTIAFVSGGNPNLKPERSRNWTANITYSPSEIRGLSVEAGYFNIVYRNRVVAPDPGFISTALADPGYSSILEYGPSEATLDSLIAQSPLGVQNYSGYPYSPADVVLLIDNRNRNVAAQHIHGVDFDASYHRDFAGGKSLQIQVSGTYLVSRQRITPELPSTEMAGTIFNPPHLRLRGGATYASPRVTLSAFANYIGPVTDTRFDPSYRVNGNTTVDLVARYNLIQELHGRGGLTVTVQANNILNEKPSVIRVTGPTDTPYDSTNFSPIGRFLAISVSRKW